jgi:hypothetical protein
MALSDLEFRAWLAGTAEFMPRRRIKMSEGQLTEEEEPLPRFTPSCGVERVPGPADDV